MLAEQNTLFAHIQMHAVGTHKKDTLWWTLQTGRICKITARTDLRQSLRCLEQYDGPRAKRISVPSGQAMRGDVGKQNLSHPQTTGCERVKRVFVGQHAR